jgi:hypothetical protein
VPASQEVAMIALRLVHLIESHSEKLSDDLVRKILRDEHTRDFQRIPGGELHERSHEIYRNLSDWLVTKGCRKAPSFRAGDIRQPILLSLDG